MTKLRLSLLAAAACATVALPIAMAGQRWGQPYINATDRYMYGAISDFRNSPDPNMRAECGTNSAGMCMFTDADGTYYFCYTLDPNHIDVIRSMSGDSYISVAWDQSGVCTYVLSYASSTAAPKVP